MERIEKVDVTVKNNPELITSDIPAGGGYGCTGYSCGHMCNNGDN